MEDRGSRVRRRVASGVWGAVVWLTIGAASAQATERQFTYTYEPETMPQGATEFEQWVTLGAGRGAATGKDNFNTWQLREEFEYGLSDRYTAALYLNTVAESFRNPSTGDDTSNFEFDGVALENRYMVANPADSPVGVALYLEPRYSGTEAELEEKLILGQRHGEWKWAVNLIHATEWDDHLRELKGEAELTAGLTRRLGARWAMGLEFRNHNEFPDYETWASTAFFLGPVLNFTEERWWITLSVLPQIFGKNFHGESDGQRHLVVDEQERINARIILGITF